VCSVSAGGWERALDAILGAGVERSKLCVQLREKGLEDGELLRRARMVAEKCRRAGALSIINDRVDIALMAGADGVHVGQADLPCAEVRRLGGEKLIVGVSSERIEQARQAVRDGASYVAVGPMFATKTKEKPRIAGPAYAAEVVKELGEIVPVVPIGGIHAGNVREVVETGVGCVAVCSAVIGAADPAAAVRELMAKVT
jgi:thiamine-phosphate pyrophosphorylase